MELLETGAAKCAGVLSLNTQHNNTFTHIDTNHEDTETQQEHAPTHGCPALDCVVQQHVLRLQCPLLQLLPLTGLSGLTAGTTCRSCRT